jgi:hypothetical protein
MMILTTTMLAMTMLLDDKVFEGTRNARRRAPLDRHGGEEGDDGNSRTRMIFGTYVCWFYEGDGRRNDGDGCLVCDGSICNSSSS